MRGSKYWLCVLLWLKMAEGVANTTDTVSKMQAVQSRFADIALALDDPYSTYVSGFPLPDYFLAVDQLKRNQQYTFLIDAFRVDERNPALAARIIEEKFCYHYDALKVLPVAGNLTTGTLHGFVTEELIHDPFMPLWYLGYISNGSDYALISVGPDGVSDILPFKQSGDKYWLPNSLERPNPSTVYRLAVDSVLNGKEPTTATPLAIDANSIYDPTNGTLSNGDIVFHRRGGDNFLFSFRREGIFTSATLVPKPLDLTN